MRRPYYHRDLGGLSIGVTVLLTVQIILALIAAIIAWVHGPGYSGDTGSDAYGLILLLQGITFIVGGVLALRWTYLAMANAHAIVPQGLRISPPMAVVWHFVPFANLVKPFNAVVEIWKVARSPGPDWPVQPISLVLVGWWAAWVIGTMIDVTAWRMLFGDAASQATGELLLPIGDLVFVVAAASFMAIVIRITAMQRAIADKARAERVARA